MGSAHARPQSKARIGGGRPESIVRSGQRADARGRAADFVGHLSQRVAQVRGGIVILNSAIIPTEGESHGVADERVHEKETLSRILKYLRRLESIFAAAPRTPGARRPKNSRLSVLCDDTHFVAAWWKAEDRRRREGGRCATKDSKKSTCKSRHLKIGRKGERGDSLITMHSTARPHLARRATASCCMGR